MKRTHSKTEPSPGENLIWFTSEVTMSSVPKPKQVSSISLHPLKPIRQWLDGLQVRDRKMAQTLATMIPAQCPFERTVKLFGRTILYIPPLCKLNPLYDELVGLRFRALCYLADECGEDISAYC